MVLSGEGNDGKTIHPSNGKSIFLFPYDLVYPILRHSRIWRCAQRSEMVVLIIKTVRDLRKNWGCNGIQDSNKYSLGWGAMMEVQMCIYILYILDYISTTMYYCKLTLKWSYMIVLGPIISRQFIFFCISQRPSGAWFKASSLVLSGTDRSSSMISCSVMLKGTWGSWGKWDMHEIITGWWFQPLWKILVNGKDYPIYYGI